MLKRLRRYYGQKHLHFVTCSCYRRLPLLGPVRARNAFVKILGEMRSRFNFALVGYVVMPEHIHLLMGEPTKGTPSTILQVLKQRVSWRLRGKRRRRGAAMQLRLRFADSEEPVRLKKASAGIFLLILLSQGHGNIVISEEVRPAWIKEDPFLDRYRPDRLSQGVSRRT
jgi:REP element-mobilizing transposase RayT